MDKRLTEPSRAFSIHRYGPNSDKYGPIDGYEGYAIPDTELAIDWIDARFGPWLKESKLTSSSDQTQYWRYPCPTILNEISLIHHSVIEASAGTGKTYTLEHIVVDKLIRTELTLNQILVMTFTEKATAELKLRIRTLLTRVILRATPMVGEFPKNSSIGIQTEGTESFWIFDSKNPTKTRGKSFLALMRLPFLQFTAFVIGS